MKKYILHNFFVTLLLMMTFTYAHAYEQRPNDKNEGRTSVAAASQKKGDVNGDGDRTIVDVTLLVNYVLGHEHNFEIWVGDLDNSNSITITDITILVNIILGADYNDPDNPTLPLDGLEGDDPGNGL